MQSFGLTDRGKVRKNNQDSILLHREINLFMVADGMGGHAFGEVASEMAVHVVNDYIQSRYCAAGLSSVDDATVMMRLNEALHDAHNAIYNHSLTLPGRDVMGTTLSLLLFSNEKAYMAHVGDSRIYRLRNGSLEKLTKDHTEIQELVDGGFVDEAEAENHRLSHVLTRVLGAPGKNVTDVRILDLVERDGFLLASDGLFRVLTAPEVQQVLCNDLTVHEKCNLLMAQALERGAPDNVSIIILEL